MFFFTDHSSIWGGFPSILVFKFLYNPYFYSFVTFLTGVLFFLKTFVALFFFDFLSVILILVGTLLSVAFYTLAERKVMASTQRRRGPNVVGFWGIFQPVADGLKLIFKERVIPTRANALVFIVAAFLPFVTAFAAWSIVPLNSEVVSDIDAGLSILLAFSSLGVYGILFSG